MPEPDPSEGSPVENPSPPQENPTPVPSARGIASWVLTGILILSLAWIAYSRLNRPVSPARAQVTTTAPTSAPQEAVDLPEIQLTGLQVAGSGIARLIDLHTILPSRPRYEITTYTVASGDTVFGIAEKFGLMPQTILWGNYYTLGDNPHMLVPDMVLNILPEDGVYHKWSEGEGLNGISRYYGVKPEEIIDWPGNNLTLASVGDFAHPNITPGTMLFVKGGQREFTSWATPRITRSNPGVAISIGPGYCKSVGDGAIGSGSFGWPANSHYLSGYDYSPATNHRGIDIDGNTGDPVYASDHGVVVYSGWNNGGYGNVIVIDHGNGWQTIYAHLDAVISGCGASVYRGGQIGTIGNTGNSFGSHLHFEMYSDDYGKVNPWNFLQ
jgi:Peptidase family M23/LysM domain